MTSNVLRYFLSSHWFMECDAFEKLRMVIERHAIGDKLNPEEVRSAIGRAPRTPNPRDRKYDVAANGVAMIPVQGPLVKHAGAVNDISGPPPTSYERIEHDLRMAMEDDGVNAVLLHIESPGGSADGCEMLSQVIGAADDKKPCFAFIDGLGASAAYYLAAPCREIMCTPNALVGSIGCMMAMQDTSKSDEKYGTKTIVVRSGPKKGLGVPGEAVSDAAIASRQKIVDGLASQFFAAVKDGRGMDDDALEKVTDGDVYLADDAKRMHLVDRIGSLSDAIDMAAAAGLKAAKTLPPGKMARPQSLNSSAQAAAAQTPTLAPDQHPKGTTMATPVALNRLVSLSNEFPAHRELILSLAAGGDGKEPASEDEIRASVKDAENKTKDATIADMKVQMESLTKSRDALRAKHAGDLQAKDEDIARLAAANAEHLVTIENLKKGNAPLRSSHQATQSSGDGKDAIAAFEAKVEELRKGGSKKPFGDCIAKFPELHMAYVRAHNPGVQVGGGA